MGKTALTFGDLKEGTEFKISRRPENSGWLPDTYRKATHATYNAICATDSRKVAYIGVNTLVIPTG
jgi:hypothetical protein